MNRKNRNIIMYCLYALVFLLAILVQNTLFGRVRLWGVKLSLLPVAIVCITLRLGHENGGLFGLLAGLVWYAAGADDGVLAIVSFTLFGIFAGWLCENLFSRRMVTAALLSAAALLVHHYADFFLKFYLADAPGGLWVWPLKITLLSVLSVPAVYLLAKAAGKVGEGK